MPLHYLLRTVRLFQSCHCLSGARVPSLLRKYSSRSRPVLLYELKPWTPALIPVRFLHPETSVRAEEKDILSEDGTLSRPDQSHVLKGEYCLNSDLGHSLDGGKTRPQSGRPMKKLSCIEVLDAFTNGLNSQHDLYCTIMDMWNILAFKKLNLSDKQLICEHPRFFKLCYEVMNLARSMSNQFLVCSLETFLLLNMNPNTRLISILLNVCKERLGTLEMEEICILAAALKMTEVSANTIVLKSGLWLLMELKLEAIKDVGTLQKLMRFAPEHLARKYENKALQMVDNFTVSQCCVMFTVVAEINLHSQRLLVSCYPKIIDCLHELSSYEIANLIRDCQKLSYVNEKLLSAVGDNIMNNICMWQMWQIKFVLGNMAGLRFRYVPLLDYFADTIMQESESLKMEYLPKLTRMCSVLNHLPAVKGDNFLETLRTTMDLYMNNMNKIELSGHVLSLYTLGLVPPPAIIELLEDKDSSREQNDVEEKRLCFIKWCLSVELGSCSLSTEKLEKIEVKFGSKKAQLHTFLKKYFRDQTLYQESMILAGKYLIDFVLTLDREQGKLVPTWDVQNLESSLNISRIAILCCYPTDFTLGSLHPLGKTALKMRHLQLLGLTVVVIPVHHFFELSEAKKVEFLRENIENISSIPNSDLANEMEQLAHPET